MASAKNIKLLIISLFLFAFLSLPQTTFAGGLLESQEGFGGGGSDAIAQTFEGGGDPQDIRVTIAKIIRVLIGFLGIVFLALLVYAGFLWMTAGGNEESITKSKKYMSRSIIGLIIILASFAITNLVIQCGVAATGGYSWHCLI